MAEIPEYVPESFISGNAVEWTIPSSDLVDFPLGGVSYAFVNSEYFFSNTSAATLPNGDVQLIISTTDSAQITPGDYKYQCYVTLDGKRSPLRSGSITVHANFADKPDGYDSRSDAEVMLDALNATLKGKASNDQISMSLQGRQLVRMEPADLIKWRDLMKAEVVQEKKAERAASGLGHSGKIRIRFC